MKGRLLLLFRLRRGFFLDPFPKLLDGAAQGVSQLRELARAENQESDEEDQEKFRETYVGQSGLLVARLGRL